MARLRGRSPRGERCRAAVPHGHWKTTTLVAGLRLGGLTAPMVIDGAMNGDAFTAYAETGATAGTGARKLCGPRAHAGLPSPR